MSIDVIQTLHTCWASHHNRKCYTVYRVFIARVK